jgi:hypothetical protein
MTTDNVKALTPELEAWLQAIDKRQDHRTDVSYLPEKLDWSNP